MFGDPVLKQLIDEALAGSYDVRIAAWRVDEFRANAGIARSEFFPAINYGGGFSRGRTSVHVPPNSTATGNLWDANVNFGWELDVWGRIRRLNESAKALYLASEDARRGVLITLVSDVARTYFTIRELDAELEITKKTVASFQETYDLFKRKLDQGAASAVETSYAAAALGEVAAQVPEIERRIEANENQLSLLLGRNPGPIPRGESIETQPVPPEVPPGLPSELLQRRPDVRQAEEDLIAANALVGVATANFFPRISLTGFFGAVGPELDNFFYPAGKAWSIAAGLLGPLFQGGRLRAEYGVAYAQWEQSKAAYERVVTSAFAETTTVLYARSKIAASIAEFESAVQAYREMVRLSQVRYDSGLADYFEVLYSMQLLFPAEIRPRPGAPRPPERLRRHLQGPRRRLEHRRTHLAVARHRGAAAGRRSGIRDETPRDRDEGVARGSWQRLVRERGTECGSSQFSGSSRRFSPPASKRRTPRRLRPPRGRWRSTRSISCRPAPASP